jgi:Ras-related GTP-binding protein C/D|tara:strand:- start:337 stop:522 length:186 start_codon:yes stop_codon:yes gene_type:complete
MVLYLREVSDYLALVCLLRESNFSKPGLLDYNIDCFRDALREIFVTKTSSTEGSNTKSLTN